MLSNARGSSPGINAGGNGGMPLCPECGGTNLTRIRHLDRWMNLCGSCGHLDEFAPRLRHASPPRPVIDGHDPRLELAIAETGLDVRTLNYLEARGILFVGQLLDVPRKEFETWRGNFGPAMKAGVFRMLRRLGFPIPADALRDRAKTHELYGKAERRRRSAG